MKSHRQDSRLLRLARWAQELTTTRRDLEQSNESYLDCLALSLLLVFVALVLALLPLCDSF